tara:strand:- start:472 stop:672 length:201 start_codon:yes stop_codon:yes gene_type:complete
MSDKYNFKTVSLRNSTYSKLNDLTKQLVPGIKLSGAKAVEKLIIDRHSNFNDEQGNSYDEKTTIKV